MEINFVKEIGEVLKIREKIIKEKKMNNKNLVSDYVRYKQLNCYGHVQRMNE